jgi:hypothetical protein
MIYKYILLINLIIIYIATNNIVIFIVLFFIENFLQLFSLFLILISRYNLRIREARDGLSKYSLRKNLVNCGFKPKCPNSKYRNIDGSCNNLRDPLLAQSNTAFSRLAAPAYADGVNKPRISVTGAELPNARLVSSVAATDKNIFDRNLTIFVMQWGQVSHLFI